ncbi:CBO0543 family protein [Halalkalibacter urbisdiaboli]|uniref:CBO0543 family protein n=1 Tax=Halalkalibacter urbisdiaboli TaxID=1960589 RepID=UPI000B434C83|nr:CBO0543 family protein [Halalkalibacter urbisdiaboli]
MDKKLENMWRILEIQNKAVQLDIQGWLMYEVFTWSWWVLLAFLIIPWIIWGKLVDKTRMLEVLLLGTIVVIITLFLDALGNEIGFWGYPTQLIPLTPEAIEFDMSIIPVGFMLIFQYYRTWASYAIALLVMSAIFAFIGEPLTHLIEAVLYLKWTYFYSFVYYIILGIVTKAIVDKVTSMYVPINNN